METSPAEAVPGFVVPVHRALTEHILLGGAPRGWRLPMRRSLLR
jgi:type IV secretion system protein TrbD